MKVNGLTIKWRHDKLQDVTSCELCDGEDLLAEEVAICGKKDIFSKDFGRKLSLRRCLKSAKMDRSVRCKIWEVYRTVPANPRW